MEFKNLFSPIMLGNLQIENRIVMAPMGIGAYNDDESVADDYIHFVKARAGDTGLIITTGSRVSEKYGKFKVIGCYDDRFIPGLNKLVKAVHEKGSKIFLQMICLGGADPEDPYVPSAEVPMYQEEWEEPVRPKELTASQIEEIIKEFVKAAGRAGQAGFDGVELTGAEDFLVSAFMCPCLNRRTDEYGGSFEKRMRFPEKIVRGIKRALGDGFPVGFKFNAFYDLPDGIDFELGVKIAQKMADAGAAYIHEWSFARLDRPMSMFKYPPMPNLYQPRNTTIPIAHNLKKNISNIPVIASGGILKPDEADSIISEGKADMVAVGRSFIADHLWAFRSGRGLRIRPCIRCHVCHHEVAVVGEIVACSVNPDVLVKNEPLKTDATKKVMVAGAGPGGITAALTASVRGHNVSLYEKGGSIGGMLIPGSAPDFKYEFSDLLEYFKEEVNSSGIELFKNRNITPGFVREKNPDTLIVATGAVPLLIDIPGIERGNVVDAVDALNNADDYRGKKIVIIGGGDVGCETALLLSRKGNDVSIVEMLDGLMKNEEIKNNTMVLEKMLKDDGVDYYLNSCVESVGEGHVRIKDGNNNITELQSDIVVIAAGYKAQSNEVNALLESCRDSHALGDCVVPGRLRQAVSEGYRIGNLV